VKHNPAFGEGASGNASEFRERCSLPPIQAARITREAFSMPAICVCNPTVARDR